MTEVSQLNVVMSFNIGCSKCGSILDIFGSIDSGSADPNTTLPERGIKTARCVNKECSDYQVLGKIVGEKFIPIES